jgi:CBS domain-containing protein
MKLKNLLKNDIPTINQNTTGNMALLIMEEYKTSHLVVLSETDFKGIVNQDSILEMEDLTHEINTILNQTKNISLNINNHICIALKTFSEHKVSIIPIFNENKYHGYITIADVVCKIGEPYQLTEIGILTIECTIEDYSLSEISRLIEQNKGKVISSFLQINPNSKNVSVDIIINQKNLTRIIKSLNRFKWNVIDTYDSSLIENLDNRFDSFLRYLNT